MVEIEPYYYNASAGDSLVLSDGASAGWVEETKTEEFFFPWRIEF